MLTRIWVRWFQAHVSTRFSLGPITSIVGPSDAGKSALIRALRWLLCNEAPAGFKRPEGNASVTVEIDGHRVQRLAGKVGYRLNDRDFAAVGRRVPDELEALFCLAEAGIQAQFDEPFCLGLSGPKAAAEINRMTGLGLVDDVVAILGRRHREARIAHETLEKLRDKAERRAAELEWVDAAMSDAAKLRRMEAEIEDSREEVAELEKWIARMRVPVDDRKILQELKAFESERDVVISARTKLDELESWLVKMRRVEQEIKSWESGTCPMCGSSL